MTRTPSAALALAAALAASGATPARAEVQDCTVIAALPATLSAQGLYCLKADLGTGLASGAAITVAANNVTIDCNGFKLGGLAAGTTTRTRGVYADGRLNTAVRNCSVRGFHIGIYFQGGGGHVAEDNRLDGNTYAGIASFESDGTVIRRNRITDTGGMLPVSTGNDGAAFGVAVQSASGALIEDNGIVDTSATTGYDRSAHGIAFFSAKGIVRDNTVQTVAASGSGTGYGIYASASAVAVRDNTLTNGGVAGVGVAATASSYCAGNHAIGFTTGFIGGCVDGGGNGGIDNP